MATTVRSLGDWEKEATKVIGGQLQRHLRLTEDARQLIVNAFRAAYAQGPPTPPSRHVMGVLLIRVFNDLRVIGLLSVRGYGVQALSLAACTYEAAYCAATISCDDKLAQEWLEHHDMKQFFRTIIEMTRTSLERWGYRNVKDVISAQYDIYSKLCAAKHSNPLFQSVHGYQFLNGKLTASVGPDVSDVGLRDGWFAIRYAVELATFVAVPSFAVSHVPAIAHPDLLKAANEIGNGLLELDVDAEARWGVGKE